MVTYWLCGEMDTKEEKSENKTEASDDKEGKIEFPSEFTGLKYVARKENKNIRSQLRGYQLED